MSRKIQPVSFNLDNVYEQKLHKYALEQDKYFSQYVKRLIEKDRSGEPSAPVASVERATSVPDIPKPANDNKPVEFKKSDVAKFLL